MNKISITKSYIEAIAPNTGALKNARELLKSFSGMRVDIDRACLYASCLGNVGAAYSVAVSLENSLRYKCSCPSRQSPCKHVLGLLMLYESNSEVFLIYSGEPEFLTQDSETKYGSGASEKTVLSIKKKNQLRLRGLKAADAMCIELMEYGLGRTSVLPEFLEKSSVLLTHKLSEVYSRWRAVLYTLLSEDQDKNMKALDMLSRYHGALTYAIDYCAARAGDEAYLIDYKIESWLGSAWTLPQLEAMGNVTENARLMQLSFSVRDNVPAKRVEETGIWMELGTGELVRTVNLRPHSALSRTRESDSFPDVLHTPKLFHYPLGHRVRWKNFTCIKPSEADFSTLTAYAVPGGGDLRESVKKQMLDIFEDSHPLALVGFNGIMSGKRGLILVDRTGEQIELSGEWAGDVIRRLPIERFGAALLEFRIENGRITASPLCLTGEQGIFRLDN